jgi:hypothetical protein
VLTGLTAWVLQHFHLNEYGLGWLLPVIFKILVIMHFAFSLYNPFPRIPSSADLQAGKLLIKKISALPGEVFIPNHNFYARMAGKRTYVSYLNLEPFLYVKNESARSTLPLEIKESLAKCKFSAIILDEPWDFWKNVIEQHYQFSSRIFDDPEVFRFKAGRNSRPQFIFIPRETELK